LLVLEKGTAAAKKEVEGIASELADPAQADALRALLDALRDPGAPGGNAPTLDGATLSRLPAPLQPLAGLQAARKALATGDADAARTAAQRAAERTTSPALGARIGAVALAARDIELPLTIAGRLEQIDSDDPTARLLRARVALLRGDLPGAARLVDRVEKTDATRLDQTAVSVVRGILAYERADVAALDAVLKKSEGDERARVELSALTTGAELMRGKAPSREAVDVLARSAAPWADLVAVDAALDSGQNDHANRLMAGWMDVLDRPLHLVRTARFARYKGRLGEAASSSRSALDAGAKTFEAVTEHVYALLARGSVLPAEKAVATLGSFEGPPVSVWLRVLVRGIMGRKLLEAAPLPGPESALRVRILAAYALARARDARVKAYAAELQDTSPAHPDVVTLGRLR
jgi:hypothetical protein